MRWRLPSNTTSQPHPSCSKTSDNSFQNKQGNANHLRQYILRLLFIWFLFHSDSNSGYHDSRRSSSQGTHPLQSPAGSVTSGTASVGQGDWNGIPRVKRKWVDVIEVSSFKESVESKIAAIQRYQYIKSKSMSQMKRPFESGPTTACLHNSLHLWHG